MSEFFYKELIGPVFSPVINVSKKEMSKTVVSAIDGLLCPEGNMFTRAQTVKNLMSLENLSVEQTAKALSLKMSDVASKLRLLEFSDTEKQTIIEYGFSEKAALKFLELDKHSRLFAMEYCNRSGYDCCEIEKYVDEFINRKNQKKQEKKEKIQRAKNKKSAGCDIGFFFNSVEKAVKLAKQAGFFVTHKREETKDEYIIHISVKK